LDDVDRDSPFPIHRAHPTVNVLGYHIPEFLLGLAFVVIAIIALLIVLRRL
jgi:hypothetical protein